MRTRTKLADVRRTATRRWSPTDEDTITRAVFIESAPEMLWEHLTRTAGIASWYDDWDRSRCVGGVVDNGHLHAGATFLLTRASGTGVVEAVCHVHLAEPCSGLGWLELSPGQPPTVVTFSLLPERGGTRLVHAKSPHRLVPHEATSSTTPFPLITADLTRSHKENRS